MRLMRISFFGVFGACRAPQQKMSFQSDCLASAVGILGRKIAMDLGIEIWAKMNGISLWCC
jgi:hypothetical protein